MRPTQRSDAIRNIRKRIVSFLSICLIVMLGIGGGFTTVYMTRTLQQDGEAYYDQANFKNFEIASSAGLSEENLEELRAVEGVAEVEGAESFTANLTRKGDKFPIQVMSLTEKVSKPKILEGALPASPKECLVARDLAGEMDLKIGDEIELTMADPAIEQDLLKEKRFRISGIMEHPDFLRQNVTYSAVIPLEAVDVDALDGTYIRAFVRLEDALDKKIFDESYTEATAKVKAELEALLPEMEVEGTVRLQTLANQRIGEEWETVKVELEKAQTKIREGEDLLEKTLEEGRTKLDEARRMVEDATSQLALARAAAEQLHGILDKYGMSEDDLLKKLEDAQAQVMDIVDTYKDLDEETIRFMVMGIIENLDPETVQEMVENYGGVDPSSYLDGQPITKDDLLQIAKELGNARDYLKDAMTLEAQLPTLEVQLEQGKAELEEGEKTYARESSLGKIKLLHGKIFYLTQETAAQVQLEVARAKARDLKGHAVLQDRECNGGYLDLLTNIRAIRSAGLAFGLLFLLVCALVCFSTLAIIIEEQKKLVGATKAFGFRNNEILKKYLIFGGGAALLGGLAGIGLAYSLSSLTLRLIDGTGMYHFHSRWGSIDLPPSLIAVAGAILLCCLATVLACAGLLRSPASLLMQGTTKKKSEQRERQSRRRRSSGSTSGRSLYSRLILRNMRDDLARVLLTIAIVAGSCFLIGVGFSCKAAFDGMPPTALKDIYNYDVRADLGSAVTEEEQEAMERYLTKEGVTHASAAYEGHLYIDQGKARAIYVLSVDPEEMDKIYTLRDPKTQKKIELPKDGLLVQSRMRENAGYENGSTLEIYDKDLVLREGEVVGAFQNYQGRVVVMSRQAYRKILGISPQDNRIFISFGDADPEKIKEGLLAISDDISFEQADAFIGRFAGVNLIYDAVVLIMSAIAILMSFMILTNLSNIFVARKKKEIIVMRINGFSRQQALGYLARETVLTTLLGLVLALILGFLCTSFIIRLLEQPDVQFIREPKLLVWLLALGVEAVFALLISWLSFRKIKNFALREIAEL